MSLNETESYMNSPLFKEAMGYFWIGKWNEGLDKLGEVEKKFPIEPELRAIRLEMEVRSHISDYEIEENRKKRRQNLLKNGVRLLLALVVIFIVVGAISTYSGWIQKQIAQAQSSFNQNVELAELSIEFRNAQQLIIAGKSDEALTAYENIKAKDPNFPGLSDAIEQAQALKDIEIKYSQAMNLLKVGDSAQALDILKEISQKMPNYRDVSLQIKSLQTQTEMNSILQQADQAFSEGLYEDAISEYESLRLMDSSFETSHVEENLFQSYIHAAQLLLLSPVPNMETLRKIDSYFSNALALRPLDREALAARTQIRLVIQDSMIGEYVSQAQGALASAPDSLEAQKSAEQYLSMALSVRSNDPDVLLQFQLAQAFIQAVSDFDSGKWDSVIELLEFVIGKQAGYANGTALQTLFDAYIARGTDYIASGEYALALEDFQRSAVLAQQLTEGEILSFEAQTMIAEAQGSLNHFQEAVFIYQDALATIGLRDRIYALQNSLSDSLTYAEYLTNNGNYQSAFYAYRNVVRSRVNAYDQTTVVTVKSGDYLTLLAHRYNTTVAAILSANNMNNQPRLTPNTQLIIPTLP
ncbi:MAG: LysM peptidoglycan-binding domain-containing protein [Anaerolineales bacterium]